MKTELGHKNIMGEQDLINLRNKIIKIFETLRGDRTFAVKVASLTSSIMKRLWGSHGPLQLNASILVDRSSRGRFLLSVTADEAVTLPMQGSSFLGGVTFKEINGALVLAVEGDLDPDKVEIARQIFSEPSLDDLMQELKVKNRHLKESFENLKKAKDLNARMESELEVGKNIQMSMLPVDFPVNDRIDLFASLFPAREVGGDFYDFHLLDEDLLYIVVGDVSGKGVPAALFMAVCKTLLKSRAVVDRSPASIITHVNNEIARENKNYMFITVFMAILDLRNGRMKYANAGHNPTYVKRKSGEITMLDNISGPVVGAMEGISYTEEEVGLEIGDVVLMYTDGVTEAMDRSGKLFSDERLATFFAEQAYKSSEAYVDGISKAVMEFEKEKEQADDITVMVLTYRDVHGPDSGERLSLEIVNEIRQIRSVAEAVGPFLAERQVSEAQINNIHVINDELLSNIIQYAFTDQEEHSIVFELVVNESSIILTYHDDGIDFNPFTMERPELELPIEERKIGGLGIHIVKTMVDEYSHERKGDNNIVKLIINL
jgi:sigma-B regulation protein RsbU (phosphoserine phosphatase)